MELKDLLIRHTEDLALNAVRTGFAASRFLTPAEAMNIQTHFTRRREVTLIYDGGFKEAERVRAVFLNPEWGEYNRNKLLTAFKISYRSQDVLTHRDVLGTLMSLGVERDTIGDVTTDALVCIPEISKCIEDLVKIGRVGVNIIKINLEELPVKSEETRIKTSTVASLRLDAVLCAAFDLSRSDSAEMIDAGRISLNHIICLQAEKKLSENSLISARGLGRAKLLEIGGVSKKGRIFIKIGLFGK